MRQKLLYFLITIFGAATLVSGWVLLGEVKNEKQKVKSEEVTQNITQEKQKIHSEQNNNTALKNQAEYRQISEKQNLPENQTTTELDNLTNSEKIFEATIMLKVQGKNLVVPYVDNMSTEDAMREAQSQYPESFSYESMEYGGDLGTFVKSINGITENNREKMHWILYINGKKSNKGISTLKLNQDDIIMWNYEKEIL